MKTMFTLFVAATLSSQAAQIQFALSPSGTSPGTGLSPLNEVPPPTNSTGSGNTIGSGIFFNTDTSILHVEVGYGSVAGFSDLTGPAVMMHIHGPAPVGSNAPVLINLRPYNIATNPAAGGFILGDIPVTSNVVPSLLAGLTYLNLHTDLNPGGEIRGQLIALATPTNLPPSITCAASSTVECGTSTTVTALVSDPDNEAVSVVWTLNGTAVQTNSFAAGSTSAGTSVSFSSVLALGTNVLAVSVTDSIGNSAACATTVTVVDTTPPVIVSISADPHTIWPPNHKMVSVRVRAVVTDTCTSATWKIISVASNEAEDAKGSGNTKPDSRITGDHTLQVRAERSGGGSGRIYTITIEAVDLSGNTAHATVTVTVPHDHGKSKPAKPPKPVKPPKPSKPAKPGNNGQGDKDEGSKSAGGKKK